MKWWRRVQVLCPPDLPTPPPQKFEIRQKAAEAPPIKGQRRNTEGVIEQRDETLYTPLSDKHITKMRNRFRKRTWGPPPEWERPTSDQLTALSNSLSSGRSPWVDFAVWGSYGARHLKENKFRAHVWVNHEFVTNMINGAHHGAWLAH